MIVNSNEFVKPVFQRASRTKENAMYIEVCSVVPEIS